MKRKKEKEAFYRVKQYNYSQANGLACSRGSGQCADWALTALLENNKQLSMDIKLSESDNFLSLKVRNYIIISDVYTPSLSHQKTFILRYDV